VAVLIPSIDLMGGKIVQLVQGDTKALEFEDFEPWIERFSKYPLVQLVDLDAALGHGDNRRLVARFAARLPCQFGGGIRSVESAQRMLAAGAKRVILGSALVKDGIVNNEFVEQLASSVGQEALVCAVDSRGGRVAIHGWRETTALTPIEMMQALEPLCGGYLYTHIETEGLMNGVPLEVIRELRHATARRLAAAGGIGSMGEVDRLNAMGVDAVVGMAIYTGRLEA
jgi:phosphoribosylformimino-5-aminoimidazole carboxamide ribotide isomerase